MFAAPSGGQIAKFQDRRGCGWLCVGHASRLCRLGLHALGDGDGAGVGVAGGGLNCANFGIFPVNLCNGSISSASSGKESVIFGSGLRSSPSSPCNSAEVAGGAPGGAAGGGASALTSGPVPFSHNASTRYRGVRRNEVGRLVSMKKSDENLFETMLR